VVPGAQLLREGEHAHSLFVVREGELQILKRGKGGTEYKLAVLKAGDCVGEMAGSTSSPGPRPRAPVGHATLYVLELGEIAKLYTSDVEAYALLVLNISREISRRLRVADDGAREHGDDGRGAVERRRRHDDAPAMPIVTD
jgi:CRP-like cAMP-binding protein